ncbi:MAG: FAD-dependent oxidoreductase [Gemmatimonadota bacterium]
MTAYESWGRYPAARHTRVTRLRWRDQRLPTPEPGATLLPYGLGRSYGDACLNDGGELVDTRHLSRFIGFDEERGILRCEAGVTLAGILDLVVPRGWFPPVTPGTKHVTVGGAIANDVHGKNHHRAGTFGCYVPRLELLRSSGQRLECSPESNPELYAATIGGLGLTGLIVWAEIRLKRIDGPAIDVESLRFESLEEFFPLAAESDAKHEYTVAWIDSLTGGRAMGRGRFLRGTHSSGGIGSRGRRSSHRTLTVPFTAPNWLCRRFLLRTLNAAYFRAHPRRTVRRRVHYEPFFYPLDRVGGWNRIYGRRGFLQYQCVVPLGERSAIGEILLRIRRSGEGSFLSVLKLFGPQGSPGLLSFPREGVTLALDFPNTGERLLTLLDELDAIVAEAGGAVYPAKDARMSPGRFSSFFPQWRDFARYVDPAFSSGFWRRVTGRGTDRR